MEALKNNSKIKVKPRSRKNIRKIVNTLRNSGG